MLKAFADMFVVYFRPGDVFKRASKRHWVYAVVPVLVMCLAYSAVFYVSYLKGKHSFYPVFLRVNPDKYYFYQMIYFTPLVFAAWTAGVLALRGTAKLFKGKGRAGNIMKASAYSIFAPWFIHFFFDAAFVSPNVHHVVLALTVLFSLIYTVKLIRYEEKTDWGGTIFVAVASFVVIVAVNFTFVR